MHAQACTHRRSPTGIGQGALSQACHRPIPAWQTACPQHAAAKKKECWQTREFLLSLGAPFEKAAAAAAEKGVTGKRLMALTKPEIVSELGVSNLQV